MACIDFHTHFFSHPFFHALASASPMGGQPQALLEDLSARTGLEIPPPSTEEHLQRWLAALDAGGVEHCVSFASLPQEAPILAEAARLAGGRITPMVLVDPRAKGAAQRTREWMGEPGFGGILLFPAMHHVHLTDPAVREVLAVVAERRGVAYVHCGLLVVRLRDLLGFPRAFDLGFANPLGVIPVADAHPEVTFVIPHFGAGFFRETLMAGAQCSNIVVDTSSSHSWLRTQPDRLDLEAVFARARDVFGPLRILCGPDSGTFPAGWRGDRLEEQTKVLVDLKLEAAEREAILGGNARRVLGLVS
jgi:predicted TIM-barrel fold metal-dependent hydrolase